MADGAAGNKDETVDPAHTSRLWAANKPCASWKGLQRQVVGGREARRFVLIVAGAQTAEVEEKSLDGQPPGLGT